MKVNIIATTKTNYVAEKEDFDVFSGLAAGVCYMTSDFETLKGEDKAKTLRRVERTKLSGHHSVYDHNNISLYLDSIPIFLATIINNEKQYTTSQKSGRYTLMSMSQKEKLLFDKWMELFKNRISKKYKNEYPDFFTDKRIETLAYENSRFLLSVFNPTSMIYTTTYRQFNNLIAFLDKQLAKTEKSNFEKKLDSYIEEFLNQLKALPYYDPKLCGNEKFRELSVFSKSNKIEEYFGDVYATTYKATFVTFAQSQRHRTINYSMKVLDNEYYIPPIIKDSPDMCELWISDIKSLGDIYPQATLLEVNEMGTLDNFILKMKERKCTFAQLEINQITNDILKKYEYALRMKIHPRAEELMSYTKGSRCTFPDFKCTAPCGFPLGVNETRDI